MIVLLAINLWPLIDFKCNNQSKDLILVMHFHHLSTVMHFSNIDRNSSISCQMSFNRCTLASSAGSLNSLPPDPTNHNITIFWIKWSFDQWVLHPNKLVVLLHRPRIHKLPCFWLSSHPFWFWLPWLSTPPSVYQCCWFLAPCGSSLEFPPAAWWFPLLMSFLLLFICLE